MLTLWAVLQQHTVKQFSSVAEQGYLRYIIQLTFDSDNLLECLICLTPYLAPAWLVSHAHTFERLGSVGDVLR